MATPPRRLDRRLRRGATGLGVALAVIAACSSGPSSPFFGDEKFLVLGVSPEEEANALSQELAVDGRTEHVRLRGTTFTALGFTEPDGRPAWVRAITPRGIALALDPVASHPLERGERYELLAPATPGLFDADGDGFDELLVRKSTYDGDDACLLVYRVQNSGFVDLVTDGEHTRQVGSIAGLHVEPCHGEAGDAGAPDAAP